MNYSSFGILALIIHLIINQDHLSIKKSGSGVTSKIRYKYYLVSMTLFYLADIAWGLLFDIKIVPIVYADTVIFFLTMVASVFLWTRFVIAYINKKPFFGKVLNVMGWAILVFEIVALIVNFFYPVVFRFDPNGEYFPGEARYVTLGSQITLFFVTAVYSLVEAVKGKGNERRPFTVVGLSGLVMTIFVILQTFYPLSPYYSVGCLIAACLIHSFVTRYEKIDRNVELGSAKKQAYIDKLTNVWNYNAYSDKMKEYENEIENGTVDEFGIVVLDLNGLKQINDSRGHDVGDKFIVTTSRIISDLFANSNVYRIGGDEFVVLLRGEDYKNRAALIGRLKEISKENLKKDDAVIALGMAEYDKDNDKNLSSVFRRADQAMYETKSELKRFKAEDAK